MDSKQLIRLWIQYLKSLKIVELNSGPDGKLTYNRPVTLQDIVTFLEVKTEYTLDEIGDAVRSVMMKSPTYDVPQNPELGHDKDIPQGQVALPGQEVPKLPGKKPGGELSTWMHNDMTPGNPEKPKTPGTGVAVRQQGGVGPARQQRPANNQDDNVIDAEPVNTKVGHDPNSVSDVEYRDVPPKEKKKAWWKRMFKEDITDKQGPGIDEKDVEQIFNTLTSSPPGSSAKDQGASGKGQRATQSAKTPKGKNPAPAASPEEQQAKKEEDLRKLKRLIRDVMTDPQRKSLWRMLKDEPLTESEINKADIKAILQTASDTRNKPSGLGRVFKGLRKDKIDVNDLQQAWKEAGFPDDTRDIKKLLLGHGFSEDDIKKVFSQVFGTYKRGKEEEPDIPQQSATMNKIVQYAKSNNLVPDLIAFLEDEYGFKESVQSDKMMIEDIRQLFTAIVKEERSGRAELIKKYDRDQLGRTKK